MHMATHVAEIAISSSDKKFLNDGSDSFYPQFAQRFTVWLIAKCGGGTNIPDSFSVEAVPAYAWLVEHVYSLELNSLQDVLLIAADRHTAEISTDERLQADFAQFEAVYYPFEILAVLRLRKNRGLVNPALDHPLFSTALSQLPAISPVYSDSLLAGVLKQARKELPNLQ
jgi:hypothetical protein